ncbi:hypothetical protein ACFTWH_08220 [Streptomyces sp. NPDC057011]|uniref:hypothetical protein n=1 Tax=unclassified Streptomyces TaxID=2593676 RepID=UPI003638BED7
MGRSASAARNGTHPTDARALICPLDDAARDDAARAVHRLLTSALTSAPLTSALTSAPLTSALTSAPLTSALTSAPLTPYAAEPRA